MTERCEEGRDITVLFRYPPTMRVLGDLQATTEVIVMTALTFAVANFGAFRQWAVETSMEQLSPDDMGDQRGRAVFTQMPRGFLMQVYEAMEIQAGET